jgi:hypothetical protein
VIGRQLPACPSNISRERYDKTEIYREAIHSELSQRIAAGEVQSEEPIIVECIEVHSEEPTIAVRHSEKYCSHIAQNVEPSNEPPFKKIGKDVENNSIF